MAVGAQMKSELLITTHKRPACSQSRFGSQEEEEEEEEEEGESTQLHLSICPIFDPRTA